MLTQENKLTNKKKTIFIVLFFSLNILNGFLVTIPEYNRSLSPYHRDLFMIMNYVLGDLGFMTVLFALSIICFKNDLNRFRFLIIITALTSIFCIGMMIFSYNYYGMLFSFGNLKALINPTGGMAFEFVFSVLGQLLVHAQYLSLIPIIVISVYFYLIKKKHSESLQTSIVGRGKSRVYFAISLSVIGVLLMMNSLTAYRQEIEETWYEENRNVLYGVQTVGLYNYYVYDFYAYYFTNVYELNEEKIKAIENYLNSLKENLRKSPIDDNYYQNNMLYHEAYKDKNLILIQAESLSNFTIGLYVNGKEITPNLNKMVQNGIYFDNFYTTVGIGNTSDAEFSTMTGLYSTGEELAIYTYSQGEYNTLARDFVTKKYNTFSIHGNTKYFYNRATIHTNLYGFDNHFGIEDLQVNEDLVHGWINDESLLKQTIDKMIASPEKDFVFPILVSCHTPYLDDGTIDAKLAELNFNIDEIEDDLLRGYLKHTYYVDYCLGQMLAYLEEKGLEDETIIAIYGDHGGGVSHDSLIINRSHLQNNINPFEEALFSYPNKVSTYAYRKLSQEVPFIIYEPSEDKIIDPQVISLVRGETDIYRTMANLFGLDNEYYFGVDSLSNEPSFIYNPRNLDSFTDEFVLFLPPLETYHPDYAFFPVEDINKYADIVKKGKDLNDKILKYKNYK